jgi:predicted nucleic acid-binding protein
MIVISDTSPLNYLILIECIDVLPELYGRVVIPEGVLAELQRESTPQVVKKWIAAHPDWLEMQERLCRSTLRKASGFPTRLYELSGGYASASEA